VIRKLDVVIQKFGIEPGEGRLFVWGAAALALAGWADVSVKNLSETLFNKRVGVEYLPLAYLFNSVLLVGTTYLATRLAARSNRPRLLPKVMFALAALLIPLWFLVRADVISAFVLLVIASKQFQSIALLTFWLAMGDLLHGRQAKRLFAPMMAGYTLGTIVGSFASDPIGRAIGNDGLLPVAAVAFAVSGLLTLPLQRLVPNRLERGSAARSRRDSSSSRWRDSESSLRALWSESQLFRLLFIGAAASGLLGPMLYFQFQYVSDQATTGEAGMLALFAQFRGYINIAVLLIQLGVTTNLFRWIGIPLSIVLSPVAYLVGFLGMSIRLNLPVGMGALAGTKLQDNAVYDPAMRILFNLFPERVRTRATGLLEGPVKRAGGAMGSLLIMGAIHFASAIAVGYIGIPIALAWLATSIALWRTYPALLLRASARRAGHGDDLEIAQMIDSNTLRVLSTHLAGSDPRPAIELISAARPQAAVPVLAAAARAAPAPTRSLLVGALDRLLERSVTKPVINSQAAEDLEALLGEPGALDERDRADVVQAYGRLITPDHSLTVLQNAKTDASAGTRLAAAAALERLGQSAWVIGNLADALEQGVASEDAVERRVAREELRASLLCSEPGPEWERALVNLAALLDRESDRADAAEAIAEVAIEHGAAAARVREAMLAQRDAADPRVRAAVLRFFGHAGIADQTPWLIDHVAVDGGWHLDPVRAAAREGLIKLGPEITDRLLVELSFGKRGTRDAILSIIRELRVEDETLRNLYERELDSIRHKLIHRLALSQELAAAIVVQRLLERTNEGLYTALLLLAAIYNEDRIAEAGDLIKWGGGAGSEVRSLEALDALLDASEKSQLMPLMGDHSLEQRAQSAAAFLGVAVPDVAQAKAALLEESDELTRVLAAETLIERPDSREHLATSADVQDHDRVLSPVEIALHLKSLPLFEGLTIRQLVNLADEVREVRHPQNTTIFVADDPGDCLYLIVEGTVRITKGPTLLVEQGPKTFFGEIAVLEGKNRTATVATTTPVRLLRLDRNDLLRLMEELPAIAICIGQSLSKRVNELSEKVSELTDRVRPGS
jgi:hypothetical protein